LGIILCLASIGKSLGIRRLYVKALLRIFEVSGFPDYEPPRIYLFVSELFHNLTFAWLPSENRSASDGST
jgi:hypothetical protein